jgi:NADH:ubiquinone oxidoreductase subunit 3 (subunit A)
MSEASQLKMVLAVLYFFLLVSGARAIGFLAAPMIGYTNYDGVVTSSNCDSAWGRASSDHLTIIVSQPNDEKEFEHLVECSEFNEGAILNQSVKVTHDYLGRVVAISYGGKEFISKDTSHMYQMVAFSIFIPILVTGLVWAHKRLRCQANA